MVCCFLYQHYKCVMVSFLCYLWWIKSICILQCFSNCFFLGSVLGRPPEKINKVLEHNLMKHDLLLNNVLIFPHGSPEYRWRRMMLKLSNILDIQIYHGAEHFRSYEQKKHWNTELFVDSVKKKKSWHLCCFWLNVLVADCGEYLSLPAIWRTFFVLCDRQKHV